MLTRGLRVGLAAANRGDYDLQFLGYAPDVEVHTDHPGWLAIDVDPVYHGTDGLRCLFDILKGGFAELRWEPREVLDAGGGRFACRLDFVGVGRGSGIEARQEAWHVVVVERGLVVRQHVLSTEEEALAALTQAASNAPRSGAMSGSTSPTASG